MFFQLLCDGEFEKKKVNTGWKNAIKNNTVLISFWPDGSMHCA